MGRKLLQFAVCVAIFLLIMALFGTPKAYQPPGWTRTAGCLKNF